MYQTTVDLSKAHPITTVPELVDFWDRLSQLGGERFSKDYRHKPTFERSLRRQGELQDLGIQLDDADLNKTSDDFKYATLYLKVYHSKDEDITTVFEHETGAYCAIKTDRSSLHVTGPNQPIVEGYLAKLLEIPQADSQPEDKPKNK